MIFLDNNSFKPKMAQNFMRADLAKILQEKFINQPVEFYDPLTFGDLQIGDNYIALPTPGDNSGHGGFKIGFYVFEKIIAVRKATAQGGGGVEYNSMRLHDGNLSEILDNMPVIKLI